MPLWTMVIGIRPAAVVWLPAPDDEGWRERPAVRSFLRARGRSPASVGLRSATPSEAAMWQRRAVVDGRFVQTELAEIIAPLVPQADIDLDEE
jgi:hypothetical protein